MRTQDVIYNHEMLVKAFFISAERAVAYFWLGRIKNGKGEKK